MIQKTEIRKVMTAIAFGLAACYGPPAIAIAESTETTQDSAPTDPDVTQAETAIASVGTLKANGVRHVSVDEAAALLARDPSIVVIDVRTGGEYRRGHIAGARNINYFSLNFSKRMKDLDPSAAYLVHCKSGHRSGRAAPIMINAGISTVIHMDGGFDAWKDAGHPVATAAHDDALPGDAAPDEGE